jgi:hypothetical protein
MFNFIKKLFGKKVTKTPATARDNNPVQFHSRPTPVETWVYANAVTRKHVVQKGDVFIVRDELHTQLGKSFLKQEAIALANTLNVPTKAEILREQERAAELRVTLEAERTLDSQRFRPLPVNRRASGSSALHDNYPKNSNYANNADNFVLNTLIVDALLTPHHSHCDSSSSSSYDSSSSCDSGSSSSSSDW